MIRVFRIEGVPRIRKGDNLAEIFSSLFEFQDGDVLAVCSTVISKAEGRVVRLEDIIPGEHAVKLAEKLGKDERFVQAVLDESKEILLEDPFILTHARFGNICVNAGIDNTNVEKEYLLLPPDDPDGSAERLKNEIERITGKNVGVVITDTNGRCFRKGVVGVAVGISGVKALEDWRGKKDLYGQELEVTVECIADEIAAFANMLMGEGDDGVPAVVFRGLEVLGNGSVKEIYRSEEEDIIRRIIKEWKRENSS
ncbi:coenzyme F420-0:L-glutamate ligase [Geoglobus acetivorans]|uniref:Coenzyme F420:L-glutamate ligase n=1 Tax=Geoglobus acetivorans TaxID=565033 RepID=A0ABZ3H5K9_GEOAI|nr:coenzyme F420-0:L-glutamate ligase [Geoglobus acetivorans]